MYQGWFLNLERNVSRRNAITRHLAERGAAERYQRFEAIDGRAVADLYQTTLDPGCLGLWLTHVKLLEAARGTQVHLHIIEDDTVVTEGAVQKFDRVLAHADRQLPDWDLIFTDAFISSTDVDAFCLLHQIHQDCRQSRNHALVDLKPIRWGGTSSLFVNKASVEKLTGLLATQWARGLPIDLHLRELVNRGTLKAYITIPFITSISDDSRQSDIRGTVSRSLAAAGAYRKSFFEDADLPAILAEIEELTKKAENPSPLRAIYLRMLQFRISDEWEHF